MKSLHPFFTLFCVAAIFSCARENISTDGATGLIAFKASGSAIVSVDTKTDAVSALNAFYVSATTGTQEMQAWENVRFTGSDIFTGGKLWAAEDPAYHFYASNAVMDASQSIAADNATDVIVAYLPHPTFRETNTLIFKHIFARLRKVTMDVPEGYAVSDVNVKITPGIGGQFDIRSGYGQTDGSGWSKVTPGESVSIASADGSVKENDLYLVPGKYTLDVSWKIRKDEYVYTYENVHYEVDLAAGKENNVTITLFGNEADEMALSLRVSLEPWNVQEASAVCTDSQPQTHPYVDLGLRADGKKILFATCNIGAASPEEYGDFFAWGETSKRYDGIKTNINGSWVTGGRFDWASTPFDTEGDGSKFSKYTSKDSYAANGTADGKYTLDASDDIAVALWGGNWRMPDKTEWDYLLSSNVSLSWTDDYEGSGIRGLVITGHGGFSSSSLFLPAAGRCYDTTIDSRGKMGNYRSRSLYTEQSDFSWDFCFEKDVRIVNRNYRYMGCSIRPVLVLPE
ncbi:MAG: hypothetical protein IJQ61_11720 [Bacteroidales bacterium]|nr:hypothetical protein [Bacteroidales bacterium]